MFNIFRKYGLFLIIPGIVLAFSVFLKLAAGPYWLAFNFDPSYQYIVNGLYLIKGIVPNHCDHPGTPVQILCSIVCRLFNMGPSAENTVIHVLMAPEFYLHAVFVVLSLFSFVTSACLAEYVFRKTKDPWAAVLAQLPALCFLVLKSGDNAEAILPVVANVSPEPMLISVLNLFNICLLMNFFAAASRERAISALLWGFVCGLGTAVKLTFLPVLALPLLILSWKDKIFFVAVFAASFVLWTLPILSKYPIIWGWISGIAMHKGNGQGILAYFLYWKNIIVEQPVWLSFLLAASVFVFGKFLNKKWDRVHFFMAATIAGVVLQFSAVTRHPGAHYLLPGLGLFSALMFLFYWSIRHLLAPRMALIFILLFVFLGVCQAAVYCFKLANFTRDIVTFNDQVRDKYLNCTFIDYYRSSDPQAALFFGDGWNLSPHLGDELSKLYPDKFYFNIWGHSIMDFSGRVWSNDLITKNPCVLFRGDGDLNFADGPFDVQLLEKGKFENINLLTGTSEKQAAFVLAGAMHLFQAGEYDKAMALALQARKFHYQPDSSVESLIQLFKPYLQH